MMNDDLKQFEQRLNRQPLNQVPGDWRAEILAAAQTFRPAPRPSFLSTINHQLSTLLWPHPKAWAGLAVVWLIILALNFSMQDGPKTMLAKSPPPSPEVMVELRQQRKLYAELMGAAETREAERPVLSPKPRSARAEMVAA